MENSDNLELPFIAPSQAQKHVTHNEALRVLDAIVQLAVLDRDRVVPPPAPAAGDRYIVAAGATGAWSGRGGEVAAWQDGSWTFYVPRPGWIAWVVGEAGLCFWTGAAWEGAADTILQNLPLLGVGTTADATNPFSAKLNKALWSARPGAEGGDGDLRFTLNKENAADILSLLMQTGCSGRAELGLIGDDDVTLKVSPDGASWKTAMTVDRASGGLRFLANTATVASAATCDIGLAAALKVSIGGTTSISSFGPAANSLRLISFEGALDLVHDAASLILPGGADIATAAGDTAIATSDAAGAWSLRSYQRASGKAVVAPTVGDIAGGPVGERRNAFINPFFDVAQEYTGPYAIMGWRQPIDMMRFFGGSGGGGAWQGELANFTPGQAEVPGNPRRYFRLTQTVAPTSSYAWIELVQGPVAIFAGEEITASFYAKVQSGTLGIFIDFVQDFGDGGSSWVYSAGGGRSFTLTTGWQRFTFTLTLPDLSGKSVNAGNLLYMRVISNSHGASLHGDFCGFCVERGAQATDLNPLPLIEAEALCRHYYERVEMRAVDGTFWAPCALKRATPVVSTSIGSVANATKNGCQLTHTGDAAAVVRFDARL